MGGGKSRWLRWAGIVSLTAFYREGRVDNPVVMPRRSPPPTPPQPRPGSGGG
jgi:hypothetical protein